MEATATTETSYRPLSGFTGILRSEFCKLRSVRSTYWMLGAAVVFNVGLAALIAIFFAGQLSGHEEATSDPTRVSLGGLHLSQIAFGVLGALVITSEYATGMIRATLSAVPQRRRMLAAKSIVFAAVALIVGLIASFGAYFVFQVVLSDDSLQSSIADPGVLRAVIGGGLYLTALGLFGLGLGAIIRSSAGTIATLLSFLFVPPLLLELLPSSWQSAINPYVPLEAGTRIYVVHGEAGSLGPWLGFGVFCLYVAVALGAGFILINHRDA